MCAGSARPRHIGTLFLTKYLFPFEAASILLLVAAVGAVVLARRRRGLEGPDEQFELRIHAPRPAYTGTMAEAAGTRIAETAPEAGAGRAAPAMGRHARAAGRWRSAGTSCVSAIIFCIGAAGVLTHRNPLVILLCLELMLNAANLALVAFSRMWGGEDGQVFALIVMVVAACEVTVGLGLIVAIYRRQHADRRRRAQRASGLTDGTDHVRLADPAVPAHRDDRHRPAVQPAARPQRGLDRDDGDRAVVRVRDRNADHDAEPQPRPSPVHILAVGLRRQRRRRREALDPRGPAVGVHGADRLGRLDADPPLLGVVHDV